MKQNLGKPDALWTRPFIMMLVLNSLSATCFFMIAPVLTKYAVSIGMTLTSAGVLAGLFSIVALVGRPFSGYASDKFNRKRLLILSTVLLALATFSYTLSENTYFLFSTRAIHGFAFAISGTVNFALASMYIPKKRMGEGIGYLGFGYIFATAIGPNIGLFVSEYYGYPMAFTLTAIVLLGSALLMTRVDYQPPIRVSSHDNAHFSMNQIIAKELLIFSFLGGIIALNNGLVTNFIALMGDARNIPNIGLFFTVTAVAMLFVRPFAGKLMDKKGLPIVLVPSYLLASLGVVLLGSASSLLIVLLSAILISFAQGAGQPSLQATCLKRFGTEKAGVATSTFYLGSDIGQGVGPIIGGAITAAYSYSTMYYFSGALLIVGAIIFIGYNSYLKKSVNTMNNEQTLSGL